MRIILLISFSISFFSTEILAQLGAIEAVKREEVDSLKPVNEAVYNRPFIKLGERTKTSIGGYLEANSNWFAEDGVSEGFSMEMRRFNIFLYSTIIPKVRFISEIEFEHGVEEIALETAQIDIEIHRSFTLRGGILLVPLGGVNINHDAPLWEFVERPLVATEIIPSTLSEIGFGVNGKFYTGPLTLTYDAYMVNGLSSNIIGNETGRTDFQSGKSEEIFSEDENGMPSFTGRLGLKHNKIVVI